MHTATTTRMDPPHIGCNTPDCPCRYYEDIPPTPSQCAETDEQLLARYKAECPAMVKFEGFPYCHYIEIVAVYNAKVQITFWPVQSISLAQPQVLAQTTTTTHATHQQGEPAAVHTSKSRASTMRHNNQRTRNYYAALNRILTRDQEKNAPPPPTFQAPLKACCTAKAPPHANRPIYTQTTTYYYRDDPRCPPPGFQ